MVGHYTAFLFTAFTLSTGETQFSDLPKPVQRTINRNLDGGTVQHIEMAENGAAPSFYKILIRPQGGAERHLHVSSDGKLLPLSGEFLSAHPIR